jgi:hypothetical protein
MATAYYESGLGFGPTNRTTWPPICVSNGRWARPVAVILAASRAEISTESWLKADNPAGGGSIRSILNGTLSRSAIRSAAMNICAYSLRSGSGVLPWATETFWLPKYFTNRFAWSGVSSRQENWDLSRAASSCASEARSLALAASFTATPSLALERSLSSVWMRLSHIPNRTSPIIPIPITASGQTDNFKNVSYGGSHQAIMSSATTERTTNTPHQIPTFSHDFDAPSNSISRAYFVPFGRYHAGKNGLRTFLFALLFGLLFWAVIFSLWWWLGWLR